MNRNEIFCENLRSKKKFRFCVFAVFDEFLRPLEKKIKTNLVQPGKMPNTPTSLSPLTSSSSYHEVDQQLLQIRARRRNRRKQQRTGRKHAKSGSLPELTITKRVKLGVEELTKYRERKNNNTSTNEERDSGELLEKEVVENAKNVRVDVKTNG